MIVENYLMLAFIYKIKACYALNNSIQYRWDLNNTTGTISVPYGVVD